MTDAKRVSESVEPRPHPQVPLNRVSLRLVEPLVPAYGPVALHLDHPLAPHLLQHLAPRPTALPPPTLHAVAQKATRASALREGNAAHSTATVVTLPVIVERAATLYSASALLLVHLLPGLRLQLIPPQATDLLLQLRRQAASQLHHRSRHHLARRPAPPHRPHQDLPRLERHHLQHLSRLARRHQTAHVVLLEGITALASCLVSAVVSLVSVEAPRYIVDRGVRLHMASVPRSREYRPLMSFVLSCV